MKKIAYIVHSLNLGGTERLAADMSIALENDFNIQIICLDEPGIWADQVRKNGVPVSSFYRQPGLDINIAVKLAGFAKKIKLIFFMPIKPRHGFMPVYQDSSILEPNCYLKSTVASIRKF